MTYRLNVLDLFCGCGGASIGLINAGQKIVGAVDIDATACEVYERNLGLKPLCRDLKYLNGEKILKAFDLKKDDIDLIVGCPPCQGFSSLRRTKYPDCTDKRKSLVTTFIHRVQEIQPKAVMFENVTGIIRKEGKIYFNKLIRKLEKMGYSQLVIWE